MRRLHMLFAILFCIVAPAHAADAVLTNNVSTSPTLKIVHMHLTGEVIEAPVQDPFGILSDQQTSLKTLIGRLETARKDQSVGAVMITLGDFSAGFGQTEEIHKQLMKFRDSKKPVYVHVDQLDSRSYLLASAADEISVVPTSMVLLVGLYGEALYIKDMLTKIGVGAEFVRCGAYKSAGEMFTRTSPSPEAAENMNWLFDSIYDRMVNEIAAGRKVKPAKVRALIDNGPYGSDEALKAKVVDRVEQRDQFIDRVKKQFGPRVTVDNRYGEKKQASNVNMNNPFEVFNLFNKMMQPERPSYRPAIGVIYIEGTIMPGYGSRNPFAESGGAYAGELRYAFEKAAADKMIKAIVIRIDSPGGSATASEIILNAARQAHAKKPVIVSMGNIAASGGYYVAMAADEIFADNHTITGSIGVFGGKLVTTEMWKKIGFNWVPYQRGKNAGILSSSGAFTEPQRAKIQNMLDEVYTAFTKHVTDSRGKKLAKPIGEIAGGRVYTGAQAVKLGLVDHIGGLDAAVEAAAKRVSLTKYDVRVIPEPLNPIDEFLSELGGKRERPSDVSLGVEGNAVLSVLGQLDPEHARAARQMLQAIGLLRTQEALVLMPNALVLR